MDRWPARLRPNPRTKPKGEREIPGEKIAELVKPYLEAEKVNAISVGVVRGHTTWTGHYGTLDSKSDQQPNDQTVYEIGSVTKVFTGLLLAKAVATEQVKLDQPIGALMTELESKNPEVGESIQLRHLSTHTSGLPRMPANFKPADPSNPYVDYDRKLLTEFLCSVTPERKPDVKGEYSNLAVGLLGDLLSARAGVGYETLLTRELTKPLAMDNTGLTLTPAQVERAAPPHNSDRDPEHALGLRCLGRCRCHPQHYRGHAEVHSSQSRSAGRQAG